MSDMSLEFRLVFALAGHSIKGLALVQIAAMVEAHPATALRALQRLHGQGLAEPMPDVRGSWRLTPRLVQVALHHQAEIDAACQALSDFKQRYSRHPA